ncbi:hypothetical protein [Microbacterium sp. H1-D42]|uniref:hypothetical protein n=1 Tax=Microbacterium sp. H1-D42 TaxID=2925844 RepID=UPI001F539342|nr:hypothetical protein [Microbacterium sp. H1-D42]UNK71726.1 hypothetical protein MNR00_04510 [Microbacterium sp. H1-D42]
MAKATPASIERDLKSSLENFKARAASIKDAYRATRQSIVDDVMASDFAKQGRLESLANETRGKLDSLRGEQDSYIKTVRSKVEQDLIGYQASDANSVLLRRDAADRARKIADESEALAMLGDAIRGGDDTLADAVGYRARQTGWINTLDAYKEARPESADSAAALAFVEGLDSDPGHNLANQITYSAPSE